MIIDQPLLQKISHLARLELDAASETALLQSLNKIVGWTEKLQEVDTSDVEPLTVMSSEQNVLQEDIPQAPLAHKLVLANAPKKDSNYFRVPQVKE